MKRRYILYIALSVASWMQAQQIRLHESSAEATNDNKVAVAFTIKGSECKVKTNETLVLCPVIKGESGRMKELPPLNIVGSRRYVMNKRKSGQPSGEVIRYKDFKDSEYQYRAQVPYEPWMNGAKVEVRKELEGCAACGKVLASAELSTVSGNVMKRAALPWLVAYVTPNAEQTKNRSVETESMLGFATNQADIHPEYMNNPRELAKIRHMIDKLKSDKDVKINSLEIVGYASPEGGAANNKRLAEKRAMALKQYIEDRYELPRSGYKISFGGENWEGLKAMVESGENEYRSELLALLADTEDTEALKGKIRKLDGGKLFAKLKAEVYPSLRVAICKANYEIRNYTDVEEARKVLAAHPQNLSLNELFLVANSYPKGSDEFNEVFEIAVRMYPDDVTANLNAAATALAKGDIEKGERYLDRVKTRQRIPELDNCRGVLLLLKGKSGAAKEYIEAAAAAGLKEAQENLNQLIN